MPILSFSAPTKNVDFKEFAKATGAAAPMNSAIADTMRKTWPALSPSTVDISTITEYGLTQKLSNSIRCF